MKNSAKRQVFLLIGIFVLTSVIVLALPIKALDDAAFTSSSSNMTTPTSAANATASTPSLKSTSTTVQFSHTAKSVASSRTKTPEMKNSNVTVQSLNPFITTESSAVTSKASFITTPTPTSNVTVSVSTTNTSSISMPAPTANVTTPISTPAATANVTTPITTPTATANVTTQISTPTATANVTTPITTPTATANITTPISTPTATANITTPITTPTATANITTPITTLAATANITTPTPTVDVTRSVTSANATASAMSSDANTRTTAANVTTSLPSSSNFTLPITYVTTPAPIINVTASKTTFNVSGPTLNVSSTASAFNVTKPTFNVTITTEPAVRPCRPISRVEHPCYNGGECFEEEDDTVVCRCPADFSGIYCETYTPVEICEGHRCCTDAEKKTCGSHGICYFEEDDEDPYCRCIGNYFGIHCDRYHSYIIEPEPEPIPPERGKAPTPTPFFITSLPQTPVSRHFVSSPVPGVLSQNSQAVSHGPGSLTGDASQFSRSSAGGGIRTSKASISIIAIIAVVGFCLILAASAVIALMLRFCNQRNLGTRNGHYTHCPRDEMESMV